jgi:hypothetical protein
MATFWNSDDWKWEPDNIWNDGYERLWFHDQFTIREIAREKFNDDIIEAMKFRFKNNVGLALLGRLPKDWQIFSDEERKDIASLQAEMRADPSYIASLEDLFTGINDLDEDTELPPIIKNSWPKSS